MNLSAKRLAAALLLIVTASAASAQSYWTYDGYGPRARGYCGTPYDGGPQYGSGGGDQYRRPTSTTASIARIRQAFQCAR